MLIECTIRRKKGTNIKFDDGEYTFGPGEGPHVCEVENKEHIKRLLSVKESFIVAGDFTAEPMTAATPSIEPEIIIPEDPVKEVDGDEPDIDSMNLKELKLYATQIGVPTRGNLYASTLRKRIKEKLAE